MSDHRKRGKKRRSFFKRSLSRFIENTVNRFSLVDFVKKKALSKKNKSSYERMSQVPEDWQHVEKIKEIAVEQTVAQFEKNGGEVNREKIREIIDSISIQYNREIHINIATSADAAFRHVFDYPVKNKPFTSKDCRELKHLHKLNQMRKNGHGVVYLINHSSHLDEFIFDLLCQHLYTGLPVFAAGQNMMKIKSIAELLVTGSYVVLRQKASKYQMSALYHYCSALSRTGSQQGIFLEAWRGGARTRDGSLRYPKKLITLKGAIDVDDDVIIQPVAISYSAVPEDLMMCSRKSAFAWIRGIGFLKTILKAPLYPKSFIWKSLENIYGRAFLTMPEPVLLSELKKKHESDKSGISLDEFVALFSIKEIAKSKKIMSSQVVAMGLMHAIRSENHALDEGVSSQLDAIKEYHLSTFNQEPDLEDFIAHNSAPDVIKDGLKTLKRRGVLSKWRKGVHGLPLVKDEIALSYYATHGDRRLYSPTADQNIVVVGAGNWGFALASLIGARILDNKKFNNASITIYDSRADIAQQIGLTRHGTGRFSDKALPKNVFVTSDLTSAFRRASEVIIASKPEDFKDHARSIIDISEQPMKVIVATRCFIPETHSLPYHVLTELIREYKRDDIEIFSLAGPVMPETLVNDVKITGVFAGPSKALKELAEMFGWPSEQAMISNDPIGVQTADILARIYSVWINFLISSNKLKSASDIGYMTASIGDEARRLAIALGADSETFNIGSVPWTTTFISVSMEGPWREFGKKIGQYAKKRNKEISNYVKKLDEQWRSEGKKLQSLVDMNECLECAKKFDVSMPIMEEAYKTFWGNV